jgi:uracil-DNA glycosylase
MTSSSLNTFWKHLRNTPQGDVFNPWKDFDPSSDIHKQAPRIRRQQLFHYLEERKNARFILVAEALGYQGGKFSGIPMTSERILLGHRRKDGLDPEFVIKTVKPEKTSHPDIRKDGFSEPTASIVWSSLIENRLDPFDFVFWNAFPWHPQDPDKGSLSNRTPSQQEFQLGYPVLKALIRYLKGPQVIAIGNHAFTHLHLLGMNAVKVRHPARGGANLFRQQIKGLATHH